MQGLGQKLEFKKVQKLETLLKLKKATLVKILK